MHPHKIVIKDAPLTTTWDAQRSATQNSIIAEETFIRRMEHRLQFAKSTTRRERYARRLPNAQARLLALKLTL